jgi:PilZ domain-containing protein
MTAIHVGVERRAAQRFGLSLPIFIRRPDYSAEEHGFTQDLSARGVYFFTDCPLQPGTEVEVTFLMPAEITLCESMRVRCRGKVVRVDNPDRGSAVSSCAQVPKVGIAVHFENYEYLTDAQTNSLASGQYDRLAPLHEKAAEKDPNGLAPAVSRSR